MAKQHQQHHHQHQPSSSSSSPSMASSSATIRPEDYAHSPVHYAIALSDHKALTKLLSPLPRLTDPSLIHTESDSLAQERLADQISSVVDRRDVPNRETPLHLAVRLNDLTSARALASVDADVSLQNAAGWNPLQEAICRRSSDLSLTLLRLHHRSAWWKWRRRLPRLVAVLRRMRDFYMEISFHFESSIVPFVGKIAPSDTYKIWKRDGNLRADTSLAGFDGLKIQRADQSFLFLDDGERELGLPSGSLLVLNRDERKIFDAFENAGSPMTESDFAGFWSQTSIYRPGMDVTKAELVGRTNWRRQERTESVGEWKAKVFEIHNVSFSFRSRKISGSSSSSSSSAAAAAATENNVAGVDHDSPLLELEEDTEEGFLVAENPNLGFSDRRRHSSFVREDREFISAGRKSFDVPASSSVADRRRLPSTAPHPQPLPALQPNKEKEFVKSLRPSVWLTEQFPLKTEDLLPLLDILANKVKAVRRLRELLTTKFPPGTFPVKVAIPVVPTVRVVITFTKFVELQSLDQFYTPFSSPSHFVREGKEAEDHQQRQKEVKASSWSSSTASWLKRSNSKQHNQRGSSVGNHEQVDPFAIPMDYMWTSVDGGNSSRRRDERLKKPKPTTRKNK